LFLIQSISLTEEKSSYNNIIVIITMPTVAAPPVPQIQNTNDHEIESPKKNRIQVSNTKKPLFFYVNLAKVISICSSSSSSFNSLSKTFILSILSQKHSFFL